VHRLLLDTSSLMYRAFFALPASITGKDGHPVNALYGYLDMVARLVRERGPDEVVHALDDDWRPAPRVAAYEGYKSERPPEPEDLTPQFEALVEVLAALGMARAWAEGWEAEDAIGSLTSHRRRGDRFDIVTGDRDLIQLVHDPEVRVLFTRRGVSELDLLDEAAVEEKYGVPPDRYADMATLRGDPSDGLPGVSGVGQKTAVQLVKAYPSIEALVKDALAERRTGAPLQRSPGLRSRIREAAGYLETMRNVVPIRRDLEVVVDAGRRDDGDLDRLGERFKVTGPLRRLRETLDD
jgi:5'-3' exonuclease